MFLFTSPASHIHTKSFSPGKGWIGIWECSDTNYIYHSFQSIELSEMAEMKWYLSLTVQFFVEIFIFHFIFSSTLWCQILMSVKAGFSSEKPTMLASKQKRCNPANVPYAALSTHLRDAHNRIRKKREQQQERGDRLTRGRSGTLSRAPCCRTLKSGWE